MPNKTKLHCICGASLKMTTSGYTEDEITQIITIWREAHIGPGHGDTDEATARRAQQALEESAEVEEWNR